MVSEATEPLLPAADGFQPAAHGVRISTGIADGAAGTTTSHSNSNSNSKETAPRLILVLSWMSASTRHVRAYLLRYRTLYPDATIVHIASSMFDATVRPDSARRRDLTPVLDVILREVSRCPPHSPPRILLHLFSNAGAYTAGLLATAYRKQTNTALPVTALVLDSTPGRATFGRLFHAFTLPLAPLPTVIRAMGTLVVVLGLAVVVGLQCVGVQDAVERSRRILNDARVINPQAPRLYLYSKVDDMVLSTDVGDHSNEAEAKGIRVRRVVFEKSAHCRHVQFYRNEYWRAVDEILSAE